MFKVICRKLFSRSNICSPIISLTNMKNQINSSTVIHTDTVTETGADVEAGRIIWMDLEMTGLDINKDHILELACIITDSELNIVAEAPELIINQPLEILNSMGEWCTKQHTKTGLIEECKKSSITIEKAENIMIDFFHLHLQRGLSPLAGNTVYMDKLFLSKYLPKVAEYMHYRIIDVSTLKELCRRWSPDTYCKAPRKQFLHRSMNDIRESIDELKYYKKNFIKI